MRQIDYLKESGTWVPRTDTIRGEIQWDHESDPLEQIPLIVVDGKELTWAEFGKTLLTYEGFQFELKFMDPADKTV